MTGSTVKVDECRCCTGVAVQTPAPVENRPGLSALAYRVGSHGLFKQSMIAHLSLAKELKKLTARVDNDPTIALLDAWASVLDVLTFYQERIANECYLRTATERRSVLEIAREIGYELGPGVAASTDLAFMLDETQGAPASAVIDVGTKVQSTPGQNEKPQIFETVEKIEARAEWNRLKPQQTEILYPSDEKTELYLAGIATNLKTGDALLIVSPDTEQNKKDGYWRFVILSKVEQDPQGNRTLVKWNPQDSHISPHYKSDGSSPLKVFALRLRASLFGFNAPHYVSVQEIDQNYASSSYGYFDTSTNNYQPMGKITSLPLYAASGDFPPIDLNIEIPLDGLYGQLVSNSWLVLRNSDNLNGLDDFAGLFFITRVSETTKELRGVKTKVTQLRVEKDDYGVNFYPKNTTVYAQSEELQLSESPVIEPVVINRASITTIPLDRMIADLPVGRTVIVSGRRETLTLKISCEGHPVGETFVVLNAQTPPLQPVTGPLIDSDGEEAHFDGAQELRTLWILLDSEGREVDLPLTPDMYTVGLDEEGLCQRLAVSRIVPVDGDHSTLELKDPISGEKNDNGSIRYSRSSVIVYANVAHATHGETKNEILGSGDASKAFQTFNLQQSPLTYISAPITGGAKSTLEVKVGDYTWEERPSLYGPSANEKAYTVRIDGNGTVGVKFGARLPSGTNNVLATYRTGTGIAGMVQAGQLNMLMTRPLGVKDVSNPLESTGGQDPESRDDARENAPLKALTLDRIVSLNDYEDFTRSFAGIGKAAAEWIWDGMKRIVHITVAAPDGSEVASTSDVYKNLVRAIDEARDTRFPVRVESYRRTTFVLKLKVRFKEGYDKDAVRTKIVELLKASYSFKQRNFGQPVRTSEILSLVQTLEGVEAVLIKELTFYTAPTSGGNQSSGSTTIVGGMAHTEARVIDAMAWAADLQDIAVSRLVDMRVLLTPGVLVARKARFIPVGMAGTIEPAKLLTLNPDFGVDCIEEMTDEPIYC